jgi:hypothetical protein
MPIDQFKKEPLILKFDHRLRLDTHSPEAKSDAGLLAYREFDDGFGPEKGRVQRPR